MKSINNLNQICCNGIRAPMQTNEQLRQSIDNIYRYCIENDVRIGVELISLALGISRQTFYRWSNGVDCDKERAEICQTARTAVSAFVEQLAFNGKLNPVLSIFALKSIGNWQDGTQEHIIVTTDKKALSLADLPQIAGNKEKTPPMHVKTDIGLKQVTFVDGGNDFANSEENAEEDTEGYSFV